MVETERTAIDATNNELYRVAYHLYCQKPDWGTFYREIMGLNGLIRRTYPTPTALAEFERGTTFQQIQQLLKDLREQRREGPETEEPIKVVTVRLPKSLHEALRVEAHEHHTSMNKLCISKLLQFVEKDFVPDE